MNFYIIILLPILIMILGMLGGQINKALRRYGIPFIGVIASVFKAEDSNKEKAKKIALLLGLIGVFSIGYGDHSWLSKWLKKEWQMRLAYALFLSIGFVFFGMWYAVPILCAVWQIQAGGFKIGKYDFLWEDAARYLTMGVLVALLIGR